ncbi:MAG TPA: undecaprenyldiphospho-muramoylpentapeptide beta-N-acetylglucosaminyltransferase [Cryomorphaceae bacterium]|nr:undecaprenyldiphospho-muramoylpentapeptide beta-N-acetylglucosaminyltransferase [Cryomorphaceae bacterium]
MHPPKIIISGGGTGGHVFPAIAIADALKARQPESRILFVGALGRMEMDRVPKAGYEIVGLPIAGLQRRLTTKNLSFPFKLLASLRKARKIVSEFQPQIAVGVGGYASGPVLRSAASRGVPTLVQEQNSFPGITNRILAKKATAVCVAYPDMNKWFPDHKIILTGNPVRKEVLDFAGKREEAAKAFGLSPDKTTVLVVGGSLGARTINESVENLLEMFHAGEFQMIWQTGKHYADRAQNAVRARNLANVVATPFIERMDLAYAMADLVVSRAGAMSVSELTLAGKPSILIPSPNVAEDHQTKNAKALADRDAAVLIPDDAAKRKLPEVLSKILGDASWRARLSENAKTLALPDAAEKIADEIFKIIRKN